MTHALAANAAVLDASEWIIVEAKTRSFIDPESADIEVIGKSQDRAEVAGEESALQPEWRVIGKREGVVNLVERRHDCDRTEHLLAPQTSVTRYVDQYAQATQWPLSVSVQARNGPHARSRRHTLPSRVPPRQG
ncbi:hypothetical protein ACVWW4_002897 [Bradyrhizobium sp. LB7.1]